WQKNPSPSFASDLAAAALVAQDGEAGRDAAEYLLARGNPLTQQVAKRLLGMTIPASPEEFDPSDHETVYRRLHELKTRLHGDPRTALLWAELARGYASLGQRDRAGEAMRVALALLPEH